MSVNHVSCSRWIHALNGAVLVSALGCGAAGAPPAPSAPEPTTGFLRNAASGWIGGQLGPLHDLDRSATALTTYDDGYYFSVEAVADLGDRAIMTEVAMTGGTERLQPGLAATFSLAGDDDRGVTMLGCVGQHIGVYDIYDLLADEVTIGVAPTTAEPGDAPGAVRLLVSAEGHWFDRDPQTGAVLTTMKTAKTHFSVLR